MKVIVIGNGKVGKTIVEHTCQEGHEVVVIDKKSDNIEEIIDEYDVTHWQPSSSRPDTR